MTESQDMQKKPIVDFRKLLQERLDKTNPLRKLAKDETTKLAKLEGIVKKLKRREKVQNSQLQTWLSEDEYSQVDIEWQEQLELQEELKDKPDDLKRYEKMNEDSRITGKQSVKLTVVKRAIDSIGRDTSLASKSAISALDKFLNTND